MQNDLIAKNTRIEELEDELALTSSRKLNPVAVPNTMSPKEKQSMQNEIDNQNEMINNLSILNDKLENEIKQLKKGSTVSNAADDGSATKIASLESKIEELTADLNFAQVDCNLKRVDANQIISNSRQRRDLLTQSLVSLNTLAKANNPAIQNKAKAKIRELNTVAQNLRD